MKKRYLLIISVFILYSCLTAQEKSICQTALWQYEIELTNTGTRSEGKIGHLLYNDTEIPFLFDRIIVDERLYLFHYRNNPWDFGGYQFDDIPFHLQIDIDTKISENDINCGWYLTENLKKKALTPEHWIWIKRDDMEAILDPYKIDSFIGEHKLNLIKPDSIREIQSGTELKIDKK